MKIAVIGNAAGGKTTLTRRLASLYGIPAFHVDSIQFVPPMAVRPQPETRSALIEIMKNQNTWIIDGYGPLDLIEDRFANADRIIFVDLPLWQHYFWFLKRQLKSIYSPRTELPAGCRELSLAHTIKVMKTIRRMHKQMRPELLKILHREPLLPKLSWIKNRAELASVQ